MFELHNVIDSLQSEARVQAREEFRKLQNDLTEQSKALHVREDARSKEIFLILLGKYLDKERDKGLPAGWRDDE